MPFLKTGTVRGGAVAVGELRHRIVLENPGTPIPDGDGGFTQVYTALTPSPVSAAIFPATARDLEYLSAGTVTSVASHVIQMRYHPGVTTQTRITFGTRVFNVTGLINVEERNIETIALAVEIIQ